MSGCRAEPVNDAKKSEKTGPRRLSVKQEPKPQTANKKKTSTQSAAPKCGRQSSSGPPAMHTDDDYPAADGETSDTSSD
jgi:hypothetical protein